MTTASRWRRLLSTPAGLAAHNLHQDAKLIPCPLCCVPAGKCCVGTVDGHGASGYSHVARRQAFTRRGAR